VAVDDDLAFLFLDREKLVARALAEGFGRFVFLSGMLGLWWQRESGDNGNASLDATLAHRREQAHFIDRLKTDAVGDVTKKALGGFDQAVAREV
jgi:hypothetical protein